MSSESLGAPIARGRSVRISGPAALPAPDPLSAVAIRAMAHQLVCANAGPSSPASLARLSAALDRDGSSLVRAYAGLHDELACFLQIDWPSCAIPHAEKAQGEFSVHAGASVCTRDTVSTCEGFISYVCELHARLGTGKNKLRTSGLFIRPDSAGNAIEFPHHSQCASELGRLQLFLRDNLELAPGLCAVVAYGVIVRTHPFDDGNGRTARTLYNLIMAGAGSRHFLPLRQICIPVQASFLIKLRRAMYGGDWSGLTAFFADATRLSVVLQGGPGAVPAAAEAAMDAL